MDRTINIPIDQKWTVKKSFSDRQIPPTRFYQWILNLVEAFSSCNSEDVEALFPINSRLVDRERDKPCLD